MAVIELKIGIPTSIYCGDYTDTSPLTLLGAIGTGPINITESLPEQFVPGLDVTIQTGLHEIQATATFYGDSDTLLKLSRGISLSDSADSAPEFTTYSLLLVYPDDTANSSWYFPQVRVVHNTPLNYSKDAATVLPLNFIWQDRDRYNTIFYKDTIDNLIPIMGSKSPY